MLTQVIRAVYKFPLTDISAGFTNVGTGGNFIYSGGTYKRQILQADPANTDDIWIGPGGLAAVGTGICLQPGERIELAFGCNGMRAITATGTQRLGHWLAN